MSHLKRELLVAAAIVTDPQGRVLLVANDWSRKGKLRYTLPGGMVEAGETMLEAIAREVKEETGLEVTHIEHLAYVVQIEDQKRHERTIAMAFKVQCRGLLNPKDPDGHIVEARFCSAEEIAQKLQEHKPLLKPLVGYLEGNRGAFHAFKSWSSDGASVLGAVKQSDA